MKTISVREFKARLGEILERVSKGEEFVVSFGKKKMNNAALIPFENYKKSKNRKIGLYDGKVKYSISENFKVTTEEFLENEILA